MPNALLFLCLLAGLNLALAVERPENNCNFFRYGTKDEGRTNIGIFTAHKANITDFYWQAKFSVRGLEKHQVDQLHGYPSNQELAANILSGKKAEVFVRFINIENNELPKLILFMLNGETLCRSEPYDDPSTTITIRRGVSVNQRRNPFIPLIPFNRRYSGADYY